MKREDVLKLLKQIQSTQQETSPGTVFDKQEMFKGLSFQQASDPKMFNMTLQQQQFMNMFKQENKNSQRTKRNAS